MAADSGIKFGRALMGIGSLMVVGGFIAAILIGNPAANKSPVGNETPVTADAYANAATACIALKSHGAFEVRSFVHCDKEVDSKCVAFATRTEVQCLDRDVHISFITRSYD